MAGNGKETRSNGRSALIVTRLSAAAWPYPPIDREQFFVETRTFLSGRALKRVRTAYEWAKYGHRGRQRRGSGRKRYFEHVRAVAWILITELKIKNWRAIVIAFLHDMIEKSYMLTLDDIAHNFGKRVAAGVKLLTKKSVGVGTLSEKEQEEYFENIERQAPVMIKIIKLCDTLHNLRSLKGCPRKSQRNQLRAGRKIILPFADRLIRQLPEKDRWRAVYLRGEIQAICDSYRNGADTSRPWMTRVSA